MTNSTERGDGLPSTGDLIAEASDLGWTPGFRPDAIYHQGVLYNLAHEEKFEGEVKYWIYREATMVGLNTYHVPGGKTITVFND